LDGGVNGQEVVREDFWDALIPGGVARL